MSNFDDAFEKIVLDQVRGLSLEISSLRSEINAVKEDIGRLKVIDAQQEKEKLEFWAERLPPIRDDINELKNRFKYIETNFKDYLKEQKNVESRLVSLENKNVVRESKHKAVSALLGAVGGGGVAALVKIILDIL